MLTNCLELRMRQRDTYYAEISRYLSSIQSTLGLETRSIEEPFNDTMITLLSCILSRLERRRSFQSRMVCGGFGLDNHLPESMFPTTEW